MSGPTNTHLTIRYSDTSPVELSFEGARLWTAQILKQTQILLRYSDKSNSRGHANESKIKQNVFKSFLSKMVEAGRQSLVVEWLRKVKKEVLEPEAWLLSDVKPVPRFCLCLCLFHCLCLLSFSPLSDHFPGSGNSSSKPLGTRRKTFQLTPTSSKALRYDKWLRGGHWCLIGTWSQKPSLVMTMTSI